VKWPMALLKSYFYYILSYLILGHATPLYVSFRHHQLREEFMAIMHLFLASIIITRNRGSQPPFSSHTLDKEIFLSYVIVLF
jgi:hypothetical protein